MCELHRQQKKGKPPTALAPPRPTGSSSSSLSESSLSAIAAKMSAADTSFPLGEVAVVAIVVNMKMICLNEAFD
jgi:hypothetical protein